jgi:UDP-N-acetylglucosamine 1-carboxyvinyltransferase
VDKLVIHGGQPLEGEIRISGSKNATLPLLAATLLAPGVYRFHNVPSLRDVRTMSHLLRILGAQVDASVHELRIDTTHARYNEAPYELVKTMRASFYVLGPLTARLREARVSLPGGCAWGPRPVDLHIRALQALGATTDLEGGFVGARAEHLRGGTFEFPVSSVGATGNTLMAAVLAQGTTVLKNCALEPEITQLAKFLNRMGADIEGVGTREMTIRGVSELHPVDADMIPDRIETGTYVCAVGIAGGRVRITHCDPHHLESPLRFAREMGVKIETGADTIVAERASTRLAPVNIVTEPYPGFPTDLQAPFMAMACLARGTSRISETIYRDRFAHVGELLRLGARITMEDDTAVIEGCTELKAAPVMSTDLRASVCLVLAGLAAQGVTEVKRVYHLDRGYEKIEEKLSKVGARITREEGEL